MFCLRAGLLPLGKVYLHIRDFSLSTKGAFVSVKSLRLQISAFPLFSVSRGLYDTPNFPSSPSHLPFSLYLFQLLAIPSSISCFTSSRQSPPFVHFLALSVPLPLLNYSFLSLGDLLLPFSAPPPFPSSHVHLHQDGLPVYW